MPADEAEESDGIPNASKSSEIAIALAAKHESVSKNATPGFFGHLDSVGLENDLLTRFMNEEAPEASRRIDMREEITTMSRE